MFELFTVILFILLGIATLKCYFKVSWKVAKIAGILLIILALLAFLVCFFLAGGLIVLIPLGLMCLAYCLVRAGS